MRVESDRFVNTDVMKLSRMLSIIHLAIFGCAFLISCLDGMFEANGGIIFGAVCVSVGSVLFVRPFFVLSAEGIQFTVQVLFLFSIPYDSIDRRQIRSIKASWDREKVVQSAGNAAVSYRRPYYGIFLQFVRGEPPRKSRFCLKRAPDCSETRKKARECARVLNCPVILK